MDYVAALNQDCRYVLLKDFGSEYPEPEENYVGKRPWDDKRDGDDVFVRGEVLRIFEDGVEHHEFHYLYRAVPGDDYSALYYVRLYWGRR